MRLTGALIVLLLIPNLALATQVEYGGNFYECDEEYSFKDFTGESFVDKQIIPGTIICRSCFSNETPDARIFQEQMVDVTFIEGNLDNVHIPEGNTVLGASQKRFKIQNDLRDWQIDEQDRPIKVLGKDYWEEKGISVDPVEIPDEKIVIGKGEDFEEVLKERMQE